MLNIILCGGSGTRLWPLSRTMLPKQFVRIFNERSLFQQTVERNTSITDSRIIISNSDQFFLALDQLSDIDTKNVKFILEPVGRNTAPAISLASMSVEPDEVVFVTSSDHLIKKHEEYVAAVKKAKELALADYLVTFGTEPEYPETGYGYIEADNEDVVSFKEKPVYAEADNYLKINAKYANENKPLKYYWNSGMFCFKAGVFLSELKRLEPLLFNACERAYKNSKNESDMKIQINMEDMLSIPSVSIDYAVMEKSDKVKVVTCNIGWSDLGSFDSLEKEFDRNHSSNTLITIKDKSMPPICIDSSNNLIINEKRQIALIDINDLIIADTADALLISKKGSSQKVRAVVDILKHEAKELMEAHRLVHRPWGTYEVFLSSDKYKIKQVIVKPGKKLSLQKHFHRNEHWVVISGIATVTVGDKKFCVRPNESTYINMGTLHRLENEEETDLVMIEVQVGEYTGEDDIVRIDDEYGR